MKSEFNSLFLWDRNNKETTTTHATEDCEKITIFRSCYRFYLLLSVETIQSSEISTSSISIPDIFMPKCVCEEVKESLDVAPTNGVGIDVNRLCK